MSSNKSVTRKGSRFNARGSSSYALRPRFKLYKSPVQRVKIFTTQTDCSCSLGAWINPWVYNYFGYTQPSTMVPAYNQIPVVANNAANGRGCLFFCEGTSLRIPRFLSQSSTASGGQMNKPLNCRVSDSAHVLNMNVTRTIHNQTSSRFVVRTFIFHNTGKQSPVFTFAPALTNGGQSLAWWGTAGVYQFFAAAAGGVPTIYNEANCISGVRAMPRNLLMDKYGVRLDGNVLSSAENVTQGVSFDPDCVDRKSDLFVDNITSIGSMRNIVGPIGVDGMFFVNNNIAAADRQYYISSSNDPDAVTTKVDHFNCRLNKRIEFEDDGENVQTKNGDFLICHMVVPAFEPIPDRMFVPPEGGSLAAPSILNNIFSEIQITTRVDCTFTDGT